MEIQVKVEVFDDPEFCNDKSEMCGKYEYQRSLCYQFDKKIGHNFITGKRKKCDQCKTAYQEAKEK